MVIAVYCLIVLFSVAQSAVTKLYNRQSTQSAVFNAIKSVTALVFFALMAAFGFQFHLPTLWFGLCYGGSLCISMYAGYKALCHGPMAITGMLISFSVVIPLVWGLAVGKEALKPLQCLALLLFLATLVLVNADRFWAKRSEESQKTRYGVWLLFVGITFLCNGVCSVLQKQHQTLYPASYSEEFMFFAMLLCAVIFSVAAIRTISFKELKAVKGKRYGVVSGLANGLANFLTLVLAGDENATVLFPIISAGTILASLLCGILLFGEKMKANHYAALASGILAVVLFKL